MGALGEETVSDVHGENMTWLLCSKFSPGSLIHECDLELLKSEM